jgi:hypothetical protein
MDEVTGEPKDEAIKALGAKLGTTLDCRRRNTAANVRTNVPRVSDSLQGFTDADATLARRIGQGIP